MTEHVDPQRGIRWLGYEWEIVMGLVAAFLL